MGKASRRKRDRQTGFQHLKSPVMKDFGCQDVRINIPGLPKISVRLNQIMEDYMEGDMTLDEFKGLAQLASLAWNLAVNPDFIKPEQVPEFVNSLGVQEDPVVLEWLIRMAAKKIELFPDDLRLVIKTDVSERSDGSFYLSVASSLDLEQPEV